MIFAKSIFQWFCKIEIVFGIGFEKEFSYLKNITKQVNVYGFYVRSNFFRHYDMQFCMKAANETSNLYNSFFPMFPLLIMWIADFIKSAI